MTMEEAQEILQEIKHYLTAGNPVWDVDEIAEALDMAIEALRNEINCVKCEHYTERETYTGIKGVCKMDTAHMEDLISRSRAIKEISEWATDILHPKNLIKEDAIGILESLPSADEQDDNRLYIRIYANDEPSRKAEKLYQICGETESQEVAQWLKEYFPSVDRPTTDCTEFMEWLKAEVLDENNWELNAVAYGEIICRKLKKLGWIDVEDGFYVDTRPTGEWVEQESDNIEKIYLCSNCENYEAWGETEKTPYCPNCGAKMFRKDGE